MTSKEALQRIKDDFEIKYDNLKNEKDRQNIIGLCEVIENDLEVLEIIKEHFIKITWDTTISKEEKEKIKEWLENEKDN